MTFQPDKSKRWQFSLKELMFAVLVTGVSFGTTPNIAGAAAFVSLIFVVLLVAARRDGAANWAMIATVAFFLRALMMPSVTSG